MLVIGQDGFAANRLDGRNNRRFRSRDNDAAERRFLRAPPDLDDHRRAGDLRQNLVRKPRRAHAGGN